MQTFNIGRAIRKFFLSAFVIVSFAAYALQQNLAAPDKINATTSTTGQQGAELFQATPTPIPGGLYKNGTYTGPKVDVYYGLVQVEAIIQNGKISDVQFLEFPNDRRTSRLINSQAMPWLQQEAIQSQTANVDVISGATLTSEGFIMSLKAALQTAKN
jgi:uncharacterized protein with FMN-binding domain